ncbi:hypothetical protein I203_105061 [Kwoniella mangroviensis CBS 8507]|uniref:uncharacterized protein n=1 Tax=Kwoniella mangroviensis CBS 8507 TaxID=1296122 RepID=UPI00080D8011|nr:uncharacterized protein I203_08408 [Kwoniella mangroviensis CBS 8507]OCF62513.1 hypothetical protein I203_08408 [Kwoniella mangroviensis CBS 8507]
MSKIVKAVGPFPAWVQELRRTGSATLSRNDTLRQPPPVHGSISDELSWLAHRGAAELLGLPSPSFRLSHVRTSVEAIYGYWHGKMSTVRGQPMAMAQCIQDEMEFNMTNIPILPSCDLGPLDDDSKYTYAVLRPLIADFNMYIYAVELQDALDRINAIDPTILKASAKESGAEIEWIRQLAGLMVEEARITLRLFWAAGPGKELVKMSLNKPWHESTNIAREMHIHLNKPLEEVEKDSPFDAAFAAVCLNPDERGTGYGTSELTNILALEQATLAETELKKKYPYAIQMVMGEYLMALELLHELPPPTSPSVEPHRPKTFAVRLNVSQSASTQICTALSFVRSMCVRSTAVENSPQLWETHREIQGIFARELKLPNELIDKLFPFMIDIPEPKRWKPVNDHNQPLEGSLENGKGTEKTGEKRKRETFQVKRKEYKLCKQMFSGDDIDVTLPELSGLFRSIGFIIEKIGGSFIRFAPPNNAGSPFIVRVPVHGTFYRDGEFPIALENIHHLVVDLFGWDLDWFTLKTDAEDGKIDEDGSDEADYDDLHGECRKGMYVFNNNGDILSEPH